MIAIAIANNPDFLIADEPTTALDVTVQAEILKLIRQLQEQYHMGVLLITHDLTIVEKVSDRVAVMRLGKIVETNGTKRLFAAPTHAYTQKLFAAAPSGRPNPVPAGSNVVLETERLRVEYHLRWGGLFSRQSQLLVAVDDVTLSLKSGETLGIVGESGSGKTTLGKAILRLLHNDGGTIGWKGERLDTRSKVEMRPLRPSLQVVFQDPFASLNPRLSVKQIIEEGLIVNGLGGNAAQRDKRVRDTLADVGLDPNTLNRFPHEFSGGQRQRIAIARALAMEPDVLVADEAVSALDVSVQAQVLSLLGELQEKLGIAILFITHDLRVAAQICDDVAVMQEGRIVEYGPAERVLRAPSEAYTRNLIEAAPGRHWDFANFRPLAAEAPANV